MYLNNRLLINEILPVKFYNIQMYNIQTFSVVKDFEIHFNTLKKKPREVKYLALIL